MKVSKFFTLPYKFIRAVVLNVNRHFVRLLDAFWYVLSGKLIRGIIETRGTSAPITLGVFFMQKVCGVNAEADWPVSHTSIIGCAKRIKIGIGCEPGLGPWSYIQGVNGIEIGDYTQIAPRVSIISANHSIYDVHSHVKGRPIRIGRYCWLGTNSVILPEVELGDHMIVAAGAIVNRSFPEGYCVIAGVPAKVVKTIQKDKVVEHRNRIEYIGYKRIK